MSIQKELVKWAKETVDVYNPIANGLGYYTQSVLNRKSLDPDLLILGINPGAAGGGTILYHPHGDGLYLCRIVAGVGIGE